ncbi:hypothetical protein Q361_1183 [Flavobacterium croceum DSM 17960]|uniref:Uncharacterized protein n=1 Tax=Flavobacterium croceum DSM 17960 TaxID=1121886 RepID=A0A2S4N549_9FLAO|nr:hypothetical protein Q361_1183 [Flavobacterium croceum DSM 17960]
MIYFLLHTNVKLIIFIVVNWLQMFVNDVLMAHKTTIFN